MITECDDLFCLDGIEQTGRRVVGREVKEGRRETMSGGDRFEFEALEPRLLLSGSDPTPEMAPEVDREPGWREEAIEEGFGECGCGDGEKSFGYEDSEEAELFAQRLALVAGDRSPDGSRLEGPERDPAKAGERVAEARVTSGPVLPHRSPVEGGKDLSGTGDPLVSANRAMEMVRALQAANPPPGMLLPNTILYPYAENTAEPGYPYMTEDGMIVLEAGDRLTGTGDFPSVMNRAGTVAPGSSPGVMNVPTFSQGPEGVLEIEIGGTGAGQFDQFNVAGLAELDGTLQIVLFGGFVPSAGNSFEIFTYGSRDGEFAHWLGTAGIPGNDALAFVPTYNDGTGTLTLTVQTTPTVIPAVGSAINSALSTLQGIGNQLDSLDEFAQSLPLVGDSLGNLVDIGQGIQSVLVNQLNTLLASTPTQAEVTAWIEGWEGTVAGAFTIDILGVLGNYGGSYWWEVQLTATQMQFNQLLTDVTGAVLGAVFDPAPTVDVAGILEFDFAFGYDGDAFIAIDALTARATIDASGTGGIGFDFAASSPLDVTGWSVDFDASVTAVPDPSILTGGRITAGTLGDIGGPIALADAFNLEDQGAVDASFTLDGELDGFVFDYTGTHTVRIESDDLFDGATVDLTIEIDGALTILDQEVAGVFVLRKTATETVLEASDVSVDLMVGPQRVLLAENGSGTFLVIDGELAGRASVTITEGPDLPNVDISGSTVELTFNTSAGPVTSIDGETVDLPAGPYYQVAGNAVITLAVPDVVLTGDFVFEPRDTDANPGNGNEEVFIAVENLEFVFGDGVAAVLEVSDGSGAFVINDEGIAGTAMADVMLGLAGIDLSGIFAIELNDTGSAQTVEVGGMPLMLVAGPYLRVKADDAELDVLGVTLSGNFTFEQRETDTGGEKVVTLAADELELPLGTLTSDLLTFENGSGLFVLTSDGVAGQASGDVSLGVPAVGLSGTLGLAINTTGAAVMETVDVGSGPQMLDVPAGPYVQVSGTGLTLNFGPVELTGDFSFEQRETEGGTQLVTVMADNVSFEFGTDLVSASNGSGLFLLRDAGMAGQATIDLEVSAFGETFVQPFAWSFNETGAPIDDAVDWEGDLKEFDLPSGPFNRFSSGGPVTLEVDLGGSPQSITAAVVLSLVEGSPGHVTVGVSEFATTLGAGSLGLEVTDGTGAFAIFENGIAGRVTAGGVTLTGAPGITLNAMGLRVLFNNTGGNVGDPAPIVVAISDNAADDVSVQFIGSEFHDFFAVSGTAAIDAAGVVKLSGDFHFRSSGTAANTFEVGVQMLNFSVMAGSFTAVAFENGTGAFVITPAGVAGEATVDFEAGVVGLMGAASLTLNTTASTASGSVVLPDGSTQTFSGIAANSFTVCLTDARINVGPISVEIPGGIEIAVVGGNVEISRKSGGALLATISASGELTINDAAILNQLTDLAGFGEIEATDFVGMLRTLLNWLSLFQNSSIFDINIPFTQNTTLGDALAWSQAVFDELYAFMISVEVQSIADIDEFIATMGPLAVGNLVFDVKIGDYTYENISVPASVAMSLGDNNMLNDPSSLIGIFNNVLATYNMEPAGAPELHDILVARVNHSLGNFPRFALALTEQGIIDHGGLQILDPDTDFSDLGFVADPDPGTAGTISQTAVTTSRYSNPEFIEALGDRIVSALGGNPADMPEYDPATLLYAFPVSFSYSPEIPNVAFDFDEDLGPIGSASASGEIEITPTLSFDFTLGFDLSAAQVPRILSSSFIPVPANGRISADAHFDLLISANPDDPAAPWIPLELPRSWTDGTSSEGTPADAPQIANNSIEDLAEDFNYLFSITPYGSSNLLDYLYVQRAGSGLAISVLDEDLDNDGVRDLVNEDVNDNSVLDSGEDLDGDGNLDAFERDWNNNGQLDDLTGTINLISIRTLQNDIFATELGFGIEAYQDPTTLDPMFRSVAQAPVKGLFIEDATFAASVEIQTTDNITGTVNLGFLAISLDDPGPNGIGTVNPYTYDAGTDTDVFDPFTAGLDEITLSLDLVDADTGETRLYLSDLLDGLEVANIADMVVGPNIEGSLFLSLTDVSASVGSVSLPTGVELFLWIPDITELEFNPEPYHSQTNNTGIFLTYPDLGAFGNFEDVSFTDIIRALKGVADVLSDLSAFSFLDQRLPLIDISVNDMLAWAVKVADLFDALQGQGSQNSIQDLLTELEDQIELLFNLDPEDSDIFSVELDTSGIVLSPVAGGGSAGVGATATYQPDGDNNDLLFTSTLPGGDFNGATIRVVGSSGIGGNSAVATWDEANKVLTIEINGGVTTANAIIAAVAGIAGTPWTATLMNGDNAAGGNSGAGTYSTSALKFRFNFMTGYANSLPFMLDLQDLVDQLGVTSPAVQEFLALATDLVTVSASGMLTVSASAKATLSFGLDLTNPGEVRPFLYDETGVVLEAKVLGTNITFEAALGGVLGIFIEDGTVTLDRDGDPDTGPGQGDTGAQFVLGLRDTNGDGRHYFTENIFNFDEIQLSLEGGVSAVLPIFAPTMGSSLGSDTDEDGDGFPDNALAIDIPDLARLFSTPRAVNGIATVRMPGDDNDFTITGNMTVPDNFRVMIVEGAGAPTFNGETLTIRVVSGMTTVNQLALAVGALGPFTVMNLPGNDGSGLASSSPLAMAAPDFSSLFENLDLCELLFSNFGVILDGLDGLLGRIQSGLEDVVSGTSLPLVGKGLMGAADFIAGFRGGLLNSLRMAIAAAGGNAQTALENAIKEAFWNSLGPGGLDILVNPATGAALDPSLGFSQLEVTIDCEEGLVVNLRLGKQIALVDTSGNPIDIDIGVPGLGLMVEGNVLVAIGFDLKFRFGYNPELGFWFDTSATGSDPELRLFFEASIPGLSATGQIAFLQLEVADSDDNPSSFVGQFIIDIMDPDGDGMLTFSEISSPGTTLSDLVRADLEAVADITLDLVGSFGGNTAFPRVLATFNLDWSWSISKGASKPVVAFTDVYLDAGSFLSNFLAPVLAEIQKVTAPVQPLIDVVTARLPVFSDLAGRTITMLTLAEVFGLLEPSTVRFIENVAQVISLINSLDGLGEGSLLIPFSAFSLSFDDTGSMSQVDFLGELDKIDFEGALTGASGPDAGSSYQSSAAGFAGEVGSLDNFSIPLFDNPGQIVNLFLGEPVGLIEWRMPTFRFEFEWIQRIPIYGPLYAQLGGGAFAEINIGFGYDSFGPQKFLSSEDRNPLDLLDGFHVLDYDENGNERPEVLLGGEIFAGVEINLTVVKVGVRGGVFVEIGFDLHDVTPDGKVRPSDIIAAIQIDPACLFDIHGEIGLFLEAFLEIDLFFFSIKKEWRFAEIVLISFDLTCPEPVLARESGSDVIVHAGTEAGAREEIDTTDGNEVFTVRHVGGSAGNEQIEVLWGNYVQPFTVTGGFIIINGGNGNDHFELRGLYSKVMIDGGIGNDTILISDVMGSVVMGGEGNDIITVTPHEDASVMTGVTLHGGGGNDTLTAGQSAITIYGDGGNDLITGSPEGDYLDGGDGADIIDAGAGDDTIYGGAGNDVIDAYTGNDTVYAGAGNDIVRGGRGDDELYGEEGDDELLGGPGNDILVGGLGSDVLNGHGGIDLLIGDDVGSIVGNVADIPTLGITVLGLSGSGNDILIGGGNVDALFGGGGDDFLYGGNLFNTGETTVIEEDHNDFFDGGPGNDTIFGDDAMGRTGERDTGIAIRSSIWFDVDLDGLHGSEEDGFANVTVTLVKAGFTTPVATTETDSVGAFAFTGLDPGTYQLEFELPTGLSFATMNVGGGDGKTSFDDSDVHPAGAMMGFTEPFTLTFDETLSSIAAGYTGAPQIVVSDVSVEEGDNGVTRAVFVVEFSGPAGVRTEVDYEIVSATASLSRGDFAPIDGSTTGTIVFEAFDTDKVVAVNVIGDQIFEGDEQFQLIVTNPFGGPNIVALGTIVDDDPVPRVNIRDALPAPGQTETDDVTFVVELTNPSSQPITVHYRTDAAYNSMALPVGNAATLFDEFPALTDEVITFLPGDIRKLVTIPISALATADDDLDEPNETFYVDLYDAHNAVIEDYRGVGTLVDDDDPVSVSISPATTVVPEGDSGFTPVLLTLSLSQASGKQVTITYATAPGTARETPWAAGATPANDGPLEDYLGLPLAGADPDTATDAELGIAVIEPGDTSATITVYVRGDYVVEADEIFFVNILSAENAVIAQDPTTETNHATIVIQDDDLPGGPVVPGDSDIRFESTMYMVDEPESGSVNVTVTLVRSSAVGQGVAVLTIREGTASAGSDYTAPSSVFRQLVVFEPGELTKTVEIEVLSGPPVEGNETVLMDLRRPTGQPMPVSPYDQSVLIIKDPLEIEILAPPLPAPAEGTDAGGAPYTTHTIPFTVRLKDGGLAPAGGVTVDFETLSITANGGTNPVDGTDFIHQSGSVTIPFNMNSTTILIDVVEDQRPELTETFAVRLSNPSGANLAPEDRAAIATIYDDDAIEVRGTVFYDSNRNGFQDFNENGIAKVLVLVVYEDGGSTVVLPVETDANGVYTADIFLGPVTIAVIGDTVKSPYQSNDPTSPYLFALLPLILGEYETTTFNEVQAMELEMVISGPDTFEPVGYRNSFSLGFPEGSDDVGRGGTDDMIFGGPGNDYIDAGAGDDHVVGGHWMTATDMNVPVNTGSYDATITVTDHTTVLPYEADPINQVLPAIYSNGDLTSGPIFSVDLSGLNLAGVIEGDIWIDLNGDGLQGLFPFNEPLLTEPVVVNLLDGAGNVVNSVVTNTGEYRFENLFVQAAASTYVVEFLIPSGYEFSSHTLPATIQNNDVFLGARTDKFEISSASPIASDIDAGVVESDFIPTVNAGGYGFGKATYSVDQEAGTLDILVLRGDSSEREILVYTLEDGTAIGGTMPPANYRDASGLLIFEPGETFQVITVEVFESGLGFCDFLDFTVTLREPTGRPIAEVSVYIFGGVEPITDDDVIYGGDDWDIILGDSGVIPGYAVIHNYDARLLPDKLGDIQYFGGPGHDILNGGNGPDFIDGQLGDDIIAGNEGNDHIEGGLGDDIVIVELDSDDISDLHGRDRIISQRDVALITLARDAGPGPDRLEHRLSNGILISTFRLYDDIFGDPSFEIAQLTGGFRANTFNVTGWTGSIYLNGHSGRDTLIVENDVAQMMLTNSNLAGMQATVFQQTYGYLKNASLSLSTGETYHLGGIENVTLIGGPGDNLIDASGYSRTPVTFEGRGGNDILRGSTRNDRFVFVADSPLGTDTVTGNGGIDTLDFSATSTAVNVDLAVLAPATHVVNAFLSLSFGDLIENVTGGMGNDTLAGNALSNRLLGGPGNDTLIGRGGNEIYAFNSDSAGEIETIIEAAGGGLDTLDFSGMPVPVNVNLAITGNQLVTGNLTIQVNDGLGGEGEIERIVGTPFNDTIRGNSFDNELYGGAGDDVLDGKGGNDLLVGGPGNDQLDGGAGANDRFVAEGNVNFVLTDSALTRSDGEVDTLKNLEFAELVGGVGPNTFNVSGWTQSGSLDGNDDLDPLVPPAPQIDTVIAAVDADFALSNALLTITPAGGGLPRNFMLIGIDAAILTGGESANTLNASGFSGSTALAGGLGNDILIGGTGADLLNGGPGNDQLTGGPGNDVIIGGAGNDTLIEEFATAGGGVTVAVHPTSLAVTGAVTAGDTLAGIENVQVTGSPHADFFDVSGWTAGGLTIAGGGGTDTVLARGDRSYDPNVPGSADDTIILTDTGIAFAGAGTIVLSGVEQAWLQGGEGDDVLDASAFTLGLTLLEGQAGNDILIGSAANSFLSGGEGDDTFRFSENGGFETATISGGEGSDTLDLSAFTLPLTLRLWDSAVQTVEPAELALRIPLLDVENAIGGSGNDVIDGNADDNVITGGPGADVLDGFGGNDTIREEADDDFILADGSLTIGATVDTLANFDRAILIAGDGDNFIDASGFSGVATIEDRGGNDTVIGAAGGTIFLAGSGDDLFRGGAGTDIYSFDADAELGSDTIDETAGGNDQLTFAATETVGVTIGLGLTGVAQTVHATNLELTLVAGTTIEFLVGGAGDDVLRGDAMDNLILGGAGNDLIDGGGGTDRVGAIRDADMILTDSSLIIIPADPALPDETDTLINIEHATLVGGEGANTLDASAFTLGGVTLAGGAGNDLLIGSSDDDILLGGDGRDVLRGGAGNDQLLGGAGDDDLTGGEGDDHLEGGPGSDIYRFNQVFDVGSDTLLERPDEGAYDRISGLGLAGITIDLHDATLQTIGNVQIVLTNGLGGAAEVEDAF